MTLTIYGVSDVWIQILIYRIQGLWTLGLSGAQLWDED